MLSEALNTEKGTRAASPRERFITRPWVSMLLLAGAILFAGLGQGDIRIDGPIYAWAAKHMVISGDWLNLYYDHGQTPYFNKPPLQFWLMALVFKVMGYSTFSAKLVSVLFGIGCIAMVYAIARLRFEPAVAATAGSALATTYSFIRNTAAVRLDAGVTFFFLVAVYAGARMLMSQEQRIGFWIMLGAACGLALMIKSGTALLCLPILIVAFTWNRRWELLLNWRAFVAVAVCAAIVLPWYLHQYHTWGQAFIDQHFRNQMLGRFESSTFGTSAWYAYLRDLATRYWPWVPLVVYGAYRLIRERMGTFDRLLVTWGFGVLLLLHLLPRKYDRYLLFVYPALAILAACGLFRTGVWERWKSVVLPHLGWASALILIVLQLAHVKFHATGYPELAQALPVIKQNEVVYAADTVPMPLQCSIRFFSNAKVVPIDSGALQNLQSGMVVVASAGAALPPHRIMSQGKSVSFFVLTNH